MYFDFVGRTYCLSANAIEMRADDMETAVDIVISMRWWLYIGAFVALVFLTFGIDRIDENARGSYVFRPLLVPGVLLIWPIVLWRWASLERNSRDWSRRYKPFRAAYAPTWTVLAVAIPLIFVASLVIRQTLPQEAPAILLSEPEPEGAPGR